MKGIILAGGSGSRLWPVTLAFSKHLLPIYDKPMIYYPLSVLMLAGIREILIITTKNDLPLFYSLLGDGSNFGITLTYKIQAEPRGIADGILLGAEHISGEKFCLILGDNIFYGPALRQKLNSAKANGRCCTIFAYEVKDSRNFGVIDLDENLEPSSIVEKPTQTKSNLAITGLYFFDSQALEVASNLTPSVRGELEITEVLQHYLYSNTLQVEILGRGYAWLDTGTNESLLEASQYVATLEKRQGYKIACLEEIAYGQGWIDGNQLEDLARHARNPDYAHYLYSLLGDAC